MTNEQKKQNRLRRCRQVFSYLLSEYLATLKPTTAAVLAKRMSKSTTWVYSHLNDLVLCGDVDSENPLAGNGYTYTPSKRALAKELSRMKEVVLPSTLAPTYMG